MVSIELKRVTLTYPVRRSRDERRIKAHARRFLDSFRWPRDFGEKKFTALDGVSLSARPGGVVGIVGANGAGKTTLLRVIAGLLEPDSGTVTVEGKVSSVFGLGAGFIPSLSGRENIYLVGALHGLEMDRVSDIEERIIDFSELGDSIDRPVKTYSSGMKARLGFSIVSFLDSDIITLDETLAAGDARFKRKAGNLIERFAHEDKILVVVSHVARVIQDYCNVAYCLHNGKIVAEGNPLEVCDYYLKDYRKGSKKSSPATELDWDDDTP